MFRDQATHCVHFLFLLLTVQRVSNSFLQILAHCRINKPIITITIIITFLHLLILRLLLNLLLLLLLLKC